METLGAKLTKTEKQIFALEEGLTALARAFGDTLPPIALAPGGTAVSYTHLTLPTN